MEGSRTLAAAGAILSSMALLAALDNTVVRIAEDIGLWQFHLTRAVMAAALILMLAALGRVRLGARRLWAVLLRGGFTAMAMLIYFGCLAFLPIGQVAAGLFSAPLWILLISRLFLGQGLTARRVIAALIGFAGVLMVLDPLGEGLRLLSFMPLLAGMFYAVGGIATREWCEGESAFAMLLWFFLSLGLFGALGLGALTLWPQEVPAGAAGFILRGVLWPTPVAWALTGLQAVGSIVGVGLIMRGYQLGEAAVVSVLEYTLIPFAAFWGYLAWGQVLSGGEMAGIAVILASGLLVALPGR